VTTPADATWWTDQAQDPSAPEVVARTTQLETVVARIGRVLRWLVLPAWALAIATALPALVLIGLGLTVPGWWKLVPVVVGAVGVWVAVAFLRAAVATTRAASDPKAVGRDALAFSRHVVGTVGILGELDAVVRGSRIGLLRRLVALWKVVKLPHEVLEFLDDLPALSWLVPPKVTETWTRLLTCLWWAVGGWFGLVVLIGLKISPVA